MIPNRQPEMSPAIGSVKTQEKKIQPSILRVKGIGGKNVSE